MPIKINQQLFKRMLTQHDCKQLNINEAIRKTGSVCKNSGAWSRVATAMAVAISVWSWSHEIPSCQCRARCGTHIWKWSCEGCPWSSATSSYIMQQFTLQKVTNMNFSSVHINNPRHKHQWHYLSILHFSKNTLDFWSSINVDRFSKLFHCSNYTKTWTCISYRDFHLTLTVFLHYLAKPENSKLWPNFYFFI